MKNSKIIMITIVAVLTTALGSVAFAKGHKGFTPERAQQRVEKRLAKMTEKLTLTSQQQTRVRAILEAKKDRLVQLHADPDMSREDRRELLRAERRATRQQIRQILTEPQRAKAQKMHAKRKAKHAQKRMRKMAKRLNLSDAQQKQVRRIMQDAKVEREAILAANQGDRGAARGELKAHRVQVQGKIRAALTPEQAQKFDAFKSKRKGKRHGQPKF